MVKVTAATSFIGDEGMWRAGETKEVSNHRAHYLIEEGLAIEAADQGTTDLQAEPSALQQAADAIGATVATKPELAPVTTASTKKPRQKPGTDLETK
jgi:ribosomal protein L9